MSHTTCRRHVRAADIAGRPETAFRHPLNSRSLAYIRALAPLGGLERLAINLVRVPADRDAFAFHRHWGEEEFVYVLEGEGVAEVADETYAVSAGDCLMFPAGTEPHHLRNPHSRDLVCLMIGVADDIDVVDFPRAGARAVFVRGQQRLLYAADTGWPFLSRRVDDGQPGERG